MNAWLNLLQKEFRMTRNSTLMSLAILLAGGLWLVFQSYSRSIGVILMPAAILLVIMLFYPAVYILKSLAWEWKVTPHLWLHCPQPAWMLLTAKLAVALLQMLVIIILAAAMLLLGISINPNPEQLFGAGFSSLFSFVLEAGTYAAVFTFAASIHIGAWVTLISAAYALAGNYLGRFRWLAGVAVFILAATGLDRLQHTWVYTQLTSWGAIDVGLPAFSPSHLTVQAGEVLFYLLLTVGLFTLSAWLIDHKVEV